MARFRGWLTAPVVGAGTEDDPYRAKVADREAAKGDRLEFVIPTFESGRREGHPKHAWALCAAAVADGSDLVADPDVVVVADHAQLDKGIGKLAATKRQRTVDLAREHEVAGVQTPRDLVRAIGQGLDENFDERHHLGSTEAPAPGSFVVDDFTDTDGVLLSAHTGATGATWTEHPSFTPDLTIKTNRVFSPGSGSSGRYYASGVPATAEYDVAGTVRCVTATAAGFGGVAGRASTSANTMYAARWITTNGVELQKINAGTSTILGTYADAPSAGNDRDLILAITDATKKVYVGGVEQLSSTDNAITAAGRVALTIYNGSTTTGFHVDSVTATDVVAPHVVAVGQVSETDTAQAVIPLKTLALGQPSETDVAQALTSAKVLAIGQASETDSASVVTPVKLAVVGQATETDLAQPISAAKTLAVGQASEVDTAQAITRLVTVHTIGQASETDLAQAIAVVTVSVLSPFRGFHIRERPPLRLHWEAENPSGRRWRWGSDEPNPANVPSDERTSSTMPGGFETADATLPRKPGTDYSDLDRLSTLRARGAGGELAWEGRLERAPRVSGEKVSVSPSAVGWQAALEDDKSAHGIYVHQDASAWGEMPVNEKLRHSTAGRDTGTLSWSSENGALICALPNQAVPAQAIAALWFLTPSGLTISKAMYLGADTSLPGGWEAPKLFSADSDASSGEINTAMTLDSTLRTVTPATAKRFQNVRMYANGTGATPAAGAMRSLKKVAMYDGSVPTHAISSTEPDGVLASDVMAHALKWAPLLSYTTESIQPSAFVIPHLAFMELTTAGEIIRQSNRFELRDWAVWEDKVFWSHERNARGRKWRARIGPAQLEETGPQIDRLWNSICVQFQDVDSSTKIVGPTGSGMDTESALLLDTDSENPANKLGIIRSDLLVMGTGTAASATEIGARFLEQTKLLDSSGRANLVGHVTDDRGVLHPAWKVRAGDTIVFTDSAFTGERRIVKADYSHSSRTCSIDIDAPPEGLAGVLEALNVSLVSLGIGS